MYRSIVAALGASAGLASAASGASQVYNLGNIFVQDFAAPYETPLAAPGFNPGKATFSTNWVANSGGPWSSEAIWAVADAPLASAVDFYWDLGPSPDSADSGASVALSWEGYRGGYDPLPDISGGPLEFIAVQVFDFSDAFWNNSVLTLSTDTAALPSGIINLGVVANAYTPFTLDTEGSSFDTELGFFNSFGGLAETDDDDGTGLLSLLNVPGLPAGDYIINAGGYNTIYGGSGYEALVDGFGSEGGNLKLNVNGSPIYTGALAEDTNQFFRITVIPSPGATGLIGLAGVAALRRRRR